MLGGSGQVMNQVGEAAQPRHNTVDETLHYGKRSKTLNQKANLENIIECLTIAEVDCGDMVKMFEIAPTRKCPHTGKSGEPPSCIRKKN